MVFKIRFWGAATAALKFLASGRRKRISQSSISFLEWRSTFFASGTGPDSHHIYISQSWDFKIESTFLERSNGIFHENKVEAFVLRALAKNTSFLCIDWIVIEITWKTKACTIFLLHCVIIWGNTGSCSSRFTSLSVTNSIKRTVFVDNNIVFNWRQNRTHNICI